MTSVFIGDGKGKGFTAGVDSNQRLLTQSISFERPDYFSTVGQSFNINTGKFTLTSANKSAVLYVKYNGTQSLVITGIFYLIGMMFFLQMN